jgi:carboxyvinyl-carboxyphosphonate phosphorylmutase
MRTVEELEHAGAAAVSIEDTVLPLRFGQPGDSEEVISVAEMMGKLRAAVAARRDPDFVLAGRTSSLRAEGLERAAERVKAYVEAGVDAIFVVGVETIEQVKVLGSAAGLPLIISPAAKAAPFDRALLAAHGARLLLQGHQPIAAAVKALREAYAHLHAGGPPEALKDKIAPAAEMDQLVRVKQFADWRKQFLL